MSKAPIALFYGSSTCYTEMAGDKIRQTLGEHLVDVYNIAETPIIEAQFYDCIILGIPTWDYGELQEDWDEIWDDIDDIDWQGKKVALYGLGDQIGYPEWFLDAMGYLHTKVAKLGATPCGYWPNEGYEFEASKALINNDTQFVGLALDDENEFDLSEQRIQSWCEQITREFGL
ncbi:flavodoxin FldB [Gilvimarinus sp. 1_MG-2023]|uniref:flavodoxin FldB n=1 Tax=Gilvimarinus sp. 1_MG-2023 TaxID=3062638 RepID=UPI0026E1BC45|nr:flavodoxin FldB [Gilvimarinus sp. 1_MG-2023]MDO6747370.1 flavodoxin FldB [Gilvimarinus sp. 1_MG-2023]